MAKKQFIYLKVKGAEMKTREEVFEIVKEFSSIFRGPICSAQNNLMVGIGKGDNCDYVIVAYLTNNNMKHIIPAVYNDVNVVVKVIDEIVP